MPEGPTLRIWGNVARAFVGRTVVRAEGSTRQIETSRLLGRSLRGVHVHGKQLSAEEEEEEENEEPEREQKKNKGTHNATKEEEEGGEIWLRYHFLLHGSLRANKLRDIPSKKTGLISKPRLLCYFSSSSTSATSSSSSSTSSAEEFLAFYHGSLREVQGPPLLFQQNPPSIDVLHPDFDFARAVSAFRALNSSHKPLKEEQDEEANEDERKARGLSKEGGRGETAASALMDQTIFAGLGNIIKVEALHSANIHPDRCNLTEEEAQRLVAAAVEIARGWLAALEAGKQWGRAQWNVYHKAYCGACGHKTRRGRHGPKGGLQRLTNWCPVCQPLSGEDQDSTEGQLNDDEGEAKGKSKTKRQQRRRSAPLKRKTVQNEKKNKMDANADEETKEAKRKKRRKSCE